jgi:hypothetical protein
VLAQMRRPVTEASPQLKPARAPQSATMPMLPRRRGA